MDYPQTLDQYQQAEALFVSDLAELIERHEGYLGTPGGHLFDETDPDADPDEIWPTYSLQSLRSVPVTGWVLVFERYDPAVMPGSFTAFEAPRHQSPAHTLGLLEQAVSRL